MRHHENSEKMVMRRKMSKKKKKRKYKLQIIIFNVISKKSNQTSVSEPNPQVNG